MEQSLINKIKEGLSLDGLDPKSYSPLSLAYIGDAIYEIVIRTIVMSAGNMSVNKYHKKSSSMVKASAQKEVFEKIEPFLTEEEILDEENEKLIEERQAARKNKDFARADEIRDQLLEQGIVLKDTREGVKWSRA